MMSGRAGRYTGRGRRSNAARGEGGRGRECKHIYTGASGTGLCAALGDHVFDYGQKYAVILMRITWEKLLKYVGATYGQDISNELHSRSIVVIPEPVLSSAQLIRHKQREVLIRNVANNILIVCQAQEDIVEAAVTTGPDIDAAIQLAILQDQIAKINFQVTVFVQVRLTDSEKV